VDGYQVNPSRSPVHTSTIHVIFASLYLPLALISSLPMVQQSQPSDTSSRIEVWLDDQPSPPRQHEPHQDLRLSRKRGRPVGGPLLDRPSRKRQYLMKVSGNAGEHEGRRLRSSHPHPPSTNPTLENRAKRPQIPSSPERLRDGSDSPQMGDADPTPRPPARQFSRMPPVPNFDPACQEGSSESNRSLGSKPRSQSPTKSLGDFQFAEIPVDTRAWSAAAIPQELKPLVIDMENIRDKIGVIPFAVRGKFAQVQESVHDFQCIEDWGTQGGKSDGKSKGNKHGESRARETCEQATDRATGGLGHDLFWYEVNKIHRANTECLVGIKPESAWNTEVHARLLRLALQGHWAANEVWYEDITQARIANKSLVPWNISSGAMQSKTVDYAIIINPSQDFSGEASTSLHNHIIEKLRREGANTGINQTVAEWVRFKPIGVNIETKKGAVSEMEGHVQLGTWLTSQYNRLRQLCDTGKDTKGRFMNNVPLPSFPVLFAQGQRWLMMIACIRDNGRIDLIRELSLGETGSVAGVYQLIAAIRRLAQWINDDYRPWFERQILGIKEGLGVM